MADMRETIVEAVGGRTHCSMTASERWSINLVNKLSKSHPEELKIIHTNPDGSMLVHFPKSWLKIRPPKRMSESQLKALEKARNA